MIGAVVLGLILLGLPALGMIYGYRHRNDPLTEDEAYAQLKANGCCVCTMCLGAHVRHGKRYYA